MVLPQWPSSSSHHSLKILLRKAYTFRSPGCLQLLSKPFQWLDFLYSILFFKDCYPYGSLLTFTSLSFASNYPSSPNHMCSCFISFPGLSGPSIMRALRVLKEQLFGNFGYLLKHKAPQHSLAPHNAKKSPGTLWKAVLWIQHMFYNPKVKTEDKIKQISITDCRSNLHMTLDKTVHSVESARWKHGKMKGLPDVLLQTSDPEGWWTVLALKSRFCSWKRKVFIILTHSYFFVFRGSQMRCNLLTLLFPWSKGVV